MRDSECLQLEDGYVRIANGILDALALYRMPSIQCYRILFVIIRKTYGFHIKETPITIREFVKRTGLSRSHVADAIRLLKEHNLIEVSDTKDGDVPPGGNKATKTYRFQKYYSKWKTYIPKRKGKQVVPPQATYLFPPQGTAPIKETYKETIKTLGQNVSDTPNDLTEKPPPEKPKKPPKKKAKPKSNGHFERWWGHYPRKVKKIDAQKAWGQMVEDPEQMIETLIQAVEKWKKTDDWKRESGRFIPYPATWLRAGQWMDEITDKEAERDAMVRRIARRIEGS